jgi:hypothetical protein
MKTNSTNACKNCPCIVESWVKTEYGNAVSPLSNEN